MGRPIKITTTIVGTGRLARSIAPLLARAGHRLVAVVGRRSPAARSVVRGVRGAAATTDPSFGVEKARLILLAVPDRSIAPVARELARLSGIDWKGRAVLHHAGALGPEPLAPLARAGAGVAVLHPLQSLGLSDLASEIVPGSHARIEGDRRGAAAARRLARGLGLTPLALGKLTPRERNAYHAAASLFSNDVLALLAVGVGLFESIGLGHRRALAALLPLARGTLRQVERAGLSGPLTGPAPRGDVETLRAHLRALATRAGASPEDREIHRLLSLRLARLAHERGETNAADTLSALGGSKRRRGL